MKQSKETTNRAGKKTSGEDAQEKRWEHVERGIVRERVKGSGGRNPEWSYYARVKIGGRNRMRGPVRTVEMARELLRQLRDEAQSQKHGLAPAPTAAPTLGTYAPRFLAWTEKNRRSHDTYRMFVRQLLQRFGNLRLSAITPSELEDYKGELQEEGAVSNATINRRTACLKAILSHAVKAKVIPFSPLAGMARGGMLEENEARSPSLDRETEAAILDAIKEDWLAFLVRLALATGCRQGELLGMRWRDFDASNGTISIAHAKAKKSRKVILPDSMLAELRERRGLPDMPIATLNDKVTTPKRMRVTKAFQRAAAKVGRSDLTFHDLRHVCATRLLHNGAQLNEIAEHLGHSLLYVTARYAHTSPDRMKDIVNRAARTPQAAMEEIGNE